jgi:predicted DCC family thiol-disulfide oxidoreductase YuxK
MSKIVTLYEGSKMDNRTTPERRMTIAEKIDGIVAQQIIANVEIGMLRRDVHAMKDLQQAWHDAKATVRLGRKLGRFTIWLSSVSGAVMALWYLLRNGGIEK